MIYIYNMYNIIPTTGYSRPFRPPIAECIIPHQLALSGSKGAARVLESSFER